MRLMLYLFVGTAAIKYVGAENYLNGFSISLLIISLILCVLQDIKELGKK